MLCVEQATAYLACAWEALAAKKGCPATELPVKFWDFSILQVSSKAMGGAHQGAPAACRALTQSVENIQGQGSMERCHELSAAVQLS